MIKMHFHSNLFFQKLGFPELVDLISVEEGFFNTNFPTERTDLFERYQSKKF